MSQGKQLVASMQVLWEHALQANMLTIAVSGTGVRRAEHVLLLARDARRRHRHEGALHFRFRISFTCSPGQACSLFRRPYQKWF